MGPRRPPSLAVVLATVLAATMAIVVSARAQEVAHYVSVDDFRAMEEGLIVPTHEYVDVVIGPDGRGTIEVGFQHMGTSALDMLRVIGDTSHDLREGFAPLDLGTLDLADLRRVVMTGTVAVEPGRLSWTADELASSAEDGLRAGRGGDPHVSPFRSGPVGDGVVRIGGGATDLGEGFSLMVDGQLHSYLRRDPRVLPLAGYLAYATELSVGRTRDCFGLLAEDYLNGRIYTFDPDAVAELEAIAADAPGLAILQEHGYGAGLKRFLDSGLAARAALNAWLSDEIDRVGLDFALDAFDYQGRGTEDQVEWAQRVTIIARVIEGLHILPGDPEFPGDDWRQRFPDLVEAATARYQADPWSETGPFTSAYAGQGWAGLVGLLLSFECGNYEY